MAIRPLLAASLAFGLAAEVAAQDKTLGTAEIVERCEPSIALVKGRSAVGTGFLVAPGVLATNAHVIRDELLGGIEVRFPSAAEGARGPLKATLLYEDVARDLAFLKVETTLPPLAVASAFRYRKGEDVTVIGNPGVGDALVLENAVSRGVLSVKAVVEGKDFYQLGIAINPGNSGGPVIDMRGQVIGVATLKTTKQESVAFCIPLDDLKAAMRKVAAQDGDAPALAQRRHQPPAAFKQLANAGAIHALGLELRRIAWRRGPLAPLDMDGPANAKLKESLGSLEALDRELFAGLIDESRAVARDAEQPREVRDLIAKLADSDKALKDLAKDPAGPLDRYEKALDGLKRDHLRLVEEASKRLKVDVPADLLAILRDPPAGEPRVASTDAASPFPPGFGPGPSLRDRMRAGLPLTPGLPGFGPTTPGFGQGMPGFGPGMSRGRMIGPRGRFGR